MLRLPSFTYLQPKTLTEALAMKTEAGPAGSYVAGGTDLYPNMKRRQQEPRTVISLMKIPELRRSDSRTVGQSDGDIVLGASLTLTELSDSPTVRQSVEVVSRAAELVSTPLLRNMGTLGGNLCLDTRCNYYDQTYEWRKAIDFCMKKDGHICWVAPSSPRCWAVSSSDVAPVMVALGAEFLLVGPKGERVVPAARLYANDGIDYLTKQPDEILALVRLPAADGWGFVGTRAAWRRRALCWAASPAFRRKSPKPAPYSPGRICPTRRSGRPRRRRTALRSRSTTPISISPGGSR